MYKVFVYCYLLKFIVSIEIVPLSSTLWDHPYSPFYDNARNSLYFSELTTGLIHRFDFNENVVYSAKIGGDIATSFIIPVEGFINRFIISDVLDVKMIEWDGKNGTVRIIGSVFSLDPKKYASTNWNTGKMSPTFHFYGGTFTATMCSNDSIPNAGLFQYTKSQGIESLVDNLKISGDFEWNVKNNLFYHLDSCENVLKEYKWNPSNGEIDNGRAIYEFDNHGDKSNFPLGMTIDTDGRLYVTKYFGSEVVQIDPKSLEVMSIPIPAEAVAGVSFGSSNLDVLFVTTDQNAFNFTNGGITDRTLSPQSGSIFMVKGLNARGFPSKKFCPVC